MEKRFIKVTNAYPKGYGNKIQLSVDGIGGMFVEGEHTILMHTTHNNGGYQVSETPDQIEKLIKESKPI